MILAPVRSGEAQTLDTQMVPILYSRVCAPRLSRQEHYKSVPGVVATSVGYTGGNSDGPTYNSVCRGDGHTEAIKVDFDPSVISYEELMRQFFADNKYGGGKKQYMSAVWAQSKEQAATAAKLANEQGSSVPVLDPTEWHDAEEYHQDYIAKSRRGYSTDPY